MELSMQEPEDTSNAETSLRGQGQAKRAGEGASEADSEGKTKVRRSRSDSPGAPASAHDGDQLNMVEELQMQEVLAESRRQSQHQSLPSASSRAPSGPQQYNAASSTAQSAHAYPSSAQSVAPQQEDDILEALALSLRQDRQSGPIGPQQSEGPSGDAGGAGVTASTLAAALSVAGQCQGNEQTSMLRESETSRVEQAVGSSNPGNGSSMGRAVTADALAAALSAASQPGLAQRAQQEQETAGPRSLPGESLSPFSERPVPIAFSGRPKWVQAALSHTPTGKPQSDNFKFPTAQTSVVLELLSQVLGIPVSNHTSSLRLEAAPNDTACQLVTLSAMDALVRTMIGRRGPGKPMLHVLSEAYEQCVQKLDKGGVDTMVAPLLEMVQDRVARKGMALLMDDDADIYFEDGEHKADLQSGLVNRTLTSNYLMGMLACASGREDLQVFESLLFAAFRSVKCNFKVANSLGPQIYILDVLTQQPQLQQSLTLLLLQEVEQMESGTWRESSSIFKSPLSVSSVVNPSTFRSNIESPTREVFTSANGYPNNRGKVESGKNFIRTCMDDSHSAVKEICMRLVKAKNSIVPQCGREAVMSWLAAVATLGESRTRGGERQAVQSVMGTQSDGFMLGALSVALRFCRPFMKGEEKFMQRLDPMYYLTNPFRVGGANFERSLAGRRQAVGSREKTKFLAPRNPTEAPHFVTECFFITQRLMHTALIPALNRYSNMWEELHRRSRRSKQPGGLTLNEHLLRDCTETQLLDPVLAAHALKFSVLQLFWLLSLIRKGNDDAFRIVPESVVHDIGSWLIFIIRGGQALLFGDVDISLLMESLVELIERRDLVRSPLVASKIVELMSVMVSPTTSLLNAQQVNPGAVVGRVVTRPGEATLVAAVLGTGAAQERLVPALMRLYSAADHVVGLDVDKDAYDKFSTRHAIDTILEQLWKDETCRMSITRLAQAELDGSSDSLFSDFVGSVLNDLMYLLKDSFDRLHDIHSIEAAMADKAGWNALDAVQQQTKQRFCEGQQHTCRGYMRMAVTTLRLLNLLSADAVVGLAFLEYPLSGRSANAMLRFIELLVGPRCSELRVEKPEQYHFFPDQMLVSVCEFMLCLGRHEKFRTVMAREHDFDAVAIKVLDTAREKLIASHHHQHAEQLESFVEEVNRIKVGMGDAHTPADSVMIEATVEAHDHENRYAFEEREQENVESVYVEKLQALAVSDFDTNAPGAYSSAFTEMSEEAGGIKPQGMKRLTKELRDFMSKAQLPIYPASSIFVRHDSDRIDKVRAMITGPDGTPYGYGCFIFDVYFPSDYPNVPPLMNLETTGRGRVRFNPNLYNDGKVCLSLLGTWHGVDAHEKWDARRSNLFQILVSIQGMILVEDPYFNEPMVDTMRNMSEGVAASTNYNAEIQLNTIRWAMIDQLKMPRPGFEEVVRLHFGLMRHRVMRQCVQWMRQAQGMDEGHRTRLAAAVDELFSLLQQL
eukprot:evm.model.scf_992.6 EVM.evm.TU.scf_992.6   scf_992:30174-39528(+)